MLDKNNRLDYICNRLQKKRADNPPQIKKDAFMLQQTKPESKPQAKSSDYYDGEFDAAIALPPKKTGGDYYSGYVGYTQKTGKTPF